MNILRLHHVGIIMPTLEQAELFLKRFNLEKDYMEYVEDYHANCLFTKYTDAESPIELIIPTEGKLTEFRDGKGGLHHIAFEVDDVKKAKEQYESMGMEMLETTPVDGAGGIIVNFLRPRYGFGVLVEFVERVLDKEDK